MGVNSGGTNSLIFGCQEREGEKGSPPRVGVNSTDYSVFDCRAEAEKTEKRERRFLMALVAIGERKVILRCDERWGRCWLLAAVSFAQ